MKQNHTHVPHLTSWFTTLIIVQVVNQLPITQGFGTHIILKNYYIMLTYGNAHTNYIYANIQLPPMHVAVAYINTYVCI